MSGGAASTGGVPYLGSKISLVSKVCRRSSGCHGNWGGLLISVGVVIAKASFTTKREALYYCIVAFLMYSFCSDFRLTFATRASYTRLILTNAR